VFSREVEENGRELVLSVEIGKKGSEERVELVFIGVLDELLRSAEGSLEGIFEDCNGATETRRRVRIVGFVSPFEEDVLELGFVLDDVSDRDDGSRGEVLARLEFRIEFLVDGRHRLVQGETVTRFESEIFGELGVSESEGSDRVNGCEDGRSRSVLVERTDSLDRPFGELGSVREFAESVETVSAKIHSSKVSSNID
jgi:hypothetical protein